MKKTFETLGRLQTRYCAASCRKRIGSCLVRKAIEQYNTSHPNAIIEWCARCNGLFLGWKRVKRSKAITEIPVYTGGLIEFGTLWGRGKVILLRYHLIKTEKIAMDIVEIVKRETEALSSTDSIIIVLSESGYRIHKPAI